MLNKWIEMLERMAKGSDFVVSAKHDSSLSADSTAAGEERVQRNLLSKLLSVWMSWDTSERRKRFNPLRARISAWLS